MQEHKKKDKTITAKSVNSRNDGMINSKPPTGKEWLKVDPDTPYYWITAAEIYNKRRFNYEFFYDVLVHIGGPEFWNKELAQIIYHFSTLKPANEDQKKAYRIHRFMLEELRVMFDMM